MAYYPGNYYPTRLLHGDDYHSQGLYGGIRAPTLDDDPYADSYPRDDHHNSLPPHPQAHRHPHVTRNPTNDPSSSVPLSVPHPREPAAPLTRSPTPSSPPTPRPSPPYLDFSATPSKLLSVPTRKLLVLDLNGALVLRSPRPPKSYRGQYQYNQHPAPRRVMRRPYLTSLRAYLFAPETRAWLDVMHAFGRDRVWLIAIWARDTLGLAEGHYNRNVQTIKDLEKPWAILEPQRLASTTHALRPSNPSEPKPKLALHASRITTSAYPEYSRHTRHADLAALRQSSPASREEETPARVASPDGKKKSLKRKRQNEEQEITSAHQPATDSADTPAKAPVLDETLLAVIGILHAARLQSSIAGWLYAGALLQENGVAWYEDAALVRLWARRGREAMQELHLTVEHGVEP
ncbi:hypothetical protein F5148DRAFT_1285244 [Russula earlei]|uniref:Uncharacterized protein n=1 Tax=Russula earlei TaxID=71964 RepID=A0ACC0U6S2_9AGAM|nr:hypothetical protein F5148DRAFT_1285244 [Russula earlei]